MLTIDQLAKLDHLATRIIAAMYRGIEWVGDHYEARLVDAAHRVAEAKAAAIGKAEDKISDLEDARAELVAYGVTSRTILQQKYKAALDALAAEIAAKEDKINADLAAAAEALVAATNDYDATIRDANDKLGVEVDA